MELTVIPTARFPWRGYLTPGLHPSPFPGALNIMIDSGLKGASPATKLLQKAKEKVTMPSTGHLATRPSQPPAPSLFFFPPVSVDLRTQ